MQKMFQGTYPVGTKVVFKLNTKGDEAVGEVQYSSSFFMEVKVVSEGPLLNRKMSVSPQAFVGIKEE